MIDLQTRVRRMEDGSVVLAIAGEVDMSVAGRIEQDLAALEAEQPSLLFLDLREVSFLDSSGLRLVLEADLRARRQGREVAVVQGPDRVHRVFLIALLDKRLRFVKDIPVARAIDAGAD